MPASILRARERARSREGTHEKPRCGRTAQSVRALGPGCVRTAGFRKAGFRNWRAHGHSDAGQQGTGFDTEAGAAAPGIGRRRAPAGRATADGAIVLRPAAVYPIEIYSDDRVSEFLAEDEMPVEVAAKVRKSLGKARSPKR